MQFTDMLRVHKTVSGIEFLDIFIYVGVIHAPHLTARM